MEEYLTTAEIANSLKVNVITIRRWIHRGLLPATRFLKEYRIKKKDFDSFIETRKARK